MLPCYPPLALACALACAATAPAIAQSQADLPCQGSDTVTAANSDLVTHDTAVITPTVKAASAQLGTARRLLFRHNAFVIGNGEIWFNRTDAHDLRISQ